MKTIVIWAFVHRMFAREMWRSPEAQTLVGSFKPHILWSLFDIRQLQLVVVADHHMHRLQTVLLQLDFGPPEIVAGRLVSGDETAPESQPPAKRRYHHLKTTAAIKDVLADNKHFSSYIPKVMKRFVAVDLLVGAVLFRFLLPSDSCVTQ